jgi:hypothetical protein
VAIGHAAGGDDPGDEAAGNADLTKPTGPASTGFATDSALEGAGFEPSVPREIGHGYKAASRSLYDYSR